MGNDDNFVKLSEREGKLIIERDEEDANALKAGIVLAQNKGVLPIQDPKTYTAVKRNGERDDCREIKTKIGQGSNLEQWERIPVLDAIC